MNRFQTRKISNLKNLIMRRGLRPLIVQRVVKANWSAAVVSICSPKLHFVRFSGGPLLMGLPNAEDSLNFPSEYCTWNCLAVYWVLSDSAASWPTVKLIWPCAYLNAELEIGIHKRVKVIKFRSDFFLIIICGLTFRIAPQLLPRFSVTNCDLQSERLEMPWNR